MRLLVIEISDLCVKFVTFTKMSSFSELSRKGLTRDGIAGIAAMSSLNHAP